MVANKHQLSSCVVLVVMPVLVPVAMRPRRRDRLWTVLMRRCVQVHGIRNTGPHALYQQMPGFPFDMSKPLHTQHRLLFGNPAEGFSKGVGVLLRITSQDK
jgi:hypothetical protein